MKHLKPYLVGVMLVLGLCFFNPVVSFAEDELDTTFGNNGRTATYLGNYGDQAYAVALQPDGRILVAGSSSNGSDLDFAVVRYNQDGSPDQTFNIDGTVTTQVGRADDEAASIAVQEDGYIVAGGYSVRDGKRNFALVRYTPDGELDYSFGLGGIVITEYGSMDDEVTAIAVDEQGRIVIAGYSTGTAGRVVVVGRYLSSGAFDLSFGYEGLSLTGVGEDALARSIDLDDEGRMVITGSFFYENRTEVMVLRLTELGELDNTFGEDGLALPANTRASSEGFGIKQHESGAILVAGLIGDPGEYDSVLFNFTEDGQPDARFGDQGMLVTEASSEDDAVLAVDVRDGLISLSGFSTVDQVREFLFISHQIEVPGNNQNDDNRAASVPFVLKTGNTKTGLKINERQVVDSSYDDYMDQVSAGGIIPVQTIVNTTPFGNASNDISYAVALQPDGKAVAAGMSDQDGVVSIAVVRYGASDSTPVADTAAAAAGWTEWIVTKEPSEVNRTGAFTGGAIADTGKSITQRGVVFSIAPDPTLDEGGSDGSSGNGGGGGTGPVISNGQPTGTLPADTTSATLRVTTNEDADCRYSTTAGIDYDSMTAAFTSTDGLSHQNLRDVTVSSGNSYTFYVRCEDNEGVQNDSDYTINFSVASSRSAGSLFKVNAYAGSVGNLIIGTAHAQDTTTTTTGASTTTTTATTNDDAKTSSGVFDMSSPEYILEGFTKDGSGVGSYSSILNDLKPGTFYYVRAYAVTSDGTIYYGNQLGLKTADSCFIATAVFGSILHPSVQLLREFRDQYLVTNLPGRIFVNLYYKYSPPVADVISGNTVLRQIVRVMLLPIIGFGWLALKIGLFSLMLVSSTLVILSYWLVSVRGSVRQA